jgi:hypothetical protein
MVAIIAGIGVNLATSEDPNGNLKAGVLLIVAAMLIAIYGGFALLISSTQRSSKSYELQLRISRVSDALNQPLVPVEQARRLIPEIRRYEAIGHRLMMRAETATYHQWFTVNVSRKGRRDIRIGYGAIFSLIPLAIANLALARWSTYAALMPFTWVAIGTCCGGMAPRIHFINLTRRHALLGSLLANRSGRLLRKISSFERP